MRLACLFVAGCLSIACGGSSPPASTPTTPPEEETSTAEQPAATEAAAGSDTSGSEGPASSGANENAGKSKPTAGDAENGSSEFVLKDADAVRDAHGATASKIKPSKTHAAMKFIVVDKEKGPIPGIVIALTSPEGWKYMTPETDDTGYTEVLLPIGKKYDLVYLSLGRQDIAATVPVPDEPNQSIRLTLRYKRFNAPPKLVLDGVNFDTGKATLRPDSFPQLDGVAEFMTYKKSARIEISGHTDNVGNPKNNKTLSENRARACRDYLVSKGIDPSRIEARGYGDERPIATNDTPAGRQLNRRIEALEL